MMTKKAEKQQSIIIFFGLMRWYTENKEVIKVNNKIMLKKIFTCYIK